MRENEEFHFVKCANKNCGILHPVKLSELDLQNESMLCKSCKEKKINHHVIVCLQCKTIVDLLPITEKEMPKQLYVKKCEKCGGTIEDELDLIGEYFNEFSFNRF